MQSLNRVSNARNRRSKMISPANLAFFKKYCFFMILKMFRCSLKLWKFVGIGPIYQNINIFIYCSLSSSPERAGALPATKMFKCMPERLTRLPAHWLFHQNLFFLMIRVSLSITIYGLQILQRSRKSGALGDRYNIWGSETNLWPTYCSFYRIKLQLVFFFDTYNILSCRLDFNDILPIWHFILLIIQINYFFFGNNSSKGDIWRSHHLKG